MRSRAVASAALLSTLALAACGIAAPTPAAEDASITVAVAASLADAMDEIASDFEAAHPGMRVRPLVIDGSNALATQLHAGAPFDVFISADERTMASVGELVGTAAPIATSTLVIVVPVGNPGGVDSLDDLARVSTVLCAPEVPCGAATGRLLELAGVEVAPRSLEPNVRSVLLKVATDSVDAGLVYATDAAASASTETIVPTGADQIVNRAMIATVVDSTHPELAEAFVDYALDAGAAVLARRGFGAP